MGTDAGRAAGAATAAAPPRNVTLPDLVHAALVEYPRYVDPETGGRCEVERVLDWMGCNGASASDSRRGSRSSRSRHGSVPIAQQFLAGRLRFTDDAARARRRRSARGLGRPADGSAALNDASGRLLRVEDGFLRSVGLGANFVRLLSWVVDRTGCTMTPPGPRTSKSLLEVRASSTPRCSSARALHIAIVEAGITRYNVGAGCVAAPGRGSPGDPGARQVESDLSIAFGTAEPESSRDLLRRVRERHPEAHVVYKPHPDVVAGLRQGTAMLADERAWCDEIVTDVPIHRLFDAGRRGRTADLARRLRGVAAARQAGHLPRQPFYAGWG